MKAKTALIILILTGLTIKLKAQIEFPVDNAKWCYSGFGDQGQDLGSFCFSPSELVEINRETYSLISYKGHPFDNYQELFYREENSQFFVLPKDSTNEILVYDFNLEIGDTFQTSWGWGLNEEITLIVQNVDTLVTLDGISRKKITLENGNYYGSWLEGIGSLEWVFVFPAYVGTVSGGYFFTCHAQMEEYIYQLGDCGLTDNTQESEVISDFEVYPNPAEQYFTIRFQNTNVDWIKLFDFSGNLVFEKQLESFESEVQISNLLHSGIYLIEVVSTKGKILTKKLLKN